MTRWDGHMSRRLAAMKNNPRADWQITDVEAVCREHGVAQPAYGRWQTL